MVTAAQYAVTTLQKFIEDNRIKNQAKVDLYKLWNRMVYADDSSLKRGWIVNCSLEPCSFMCIVVTTG